MKQVDGKSWLTVDVVRFRGGEDFCVVGMG